MAFLDHNRDSLVIRIVYDGPPFSGKTTTLRALAAGVGRPVETPEEHEGRTLYFDWLDYTAGSYEGRRIRCQIVSVPGQRGLAERRRQILRDADAVVFVADTGRLGMELSLKYASDLAAILASQVMPRPGIVVQANKRDAEDADDMVAVAQAFRLAGIEAAFVEATAHTGGGVREAFLCGVRLALDRVREMTRLGLLKMGAPEVDSSQELLRNLVVLAGAGSSPPATQNPGTQKLAMQNPAVAPRDEDCDLPNTTIPSGLIWPPVDGRLYLQQALIGQTLNKRMAAGGDILADNGNGWRMHSRPKDLFTNQNEGRIALTNWARLHARNAEFLSGRRCLVLSPAGSQWRLWQIVGNKPSLLESVTSNLARLDPRELADHLLGVGRTLLAAAAAFRRATIPLGTEPGRVGADRSRPVYIDVSPGYDIESDAGQASSIPDADVLLRPLAEPLKQSLGGHVARETLETLRRLGETSPEAGDLAAALLRMLTGAGVGAT